MPGRQPPLPVIIGLFSVLASLIFSESGFAAPYIEEVDPPVLRRGAVTRVTIRGEDLHQAVGIWLSSPTGRATASVVSERSGEAILEVTVPGDAPLGMHGLRLATRSGLSNVHIVLIDELPLTRASQKAASPDAALDVDLPCCVTAPCRPAGIDRYAIKVAAGQTVAFEVVGSRFGKNYDPLITVRDEAGRIVASRDNDPGLFYDCRFAHAFKSSGRFIVEVRDARYEGDASWNYVLRIGDFPAANVVVPSAALPGTARQFLIPESSGESLTLKLPTRPRMPTFFLEVRYSPDSPATWVPMDATSLEQHSIESEPNDDPDETATLATVPGTLNGVLGTRGDRDCFALHLTKGQTLNFTGVSREIGSAADLELVMFGPDGREVRRIDDATDYFQSKAFPVEARFPFAARADGLHWLMVQDLVGDGGPSFAYRIDVTEPKPTLKLTADVSRLTVPQDSWQPLPIKVARTAVAGPIELSLIGAPPGISIVPTTIPADATDIVCRIVASGVAPTGISTLEIVGHWKSEDGKSEAEGVVTVRPMIDRQIIDKDRRLHSLRDNQLRLPPSLRSRLALMITPPAPFSIELPEELIVLTKYQTASFPITTQRSGGFDSPIVFQATGGQVGVVEQERDNVYAEIPTATVDRPKVEGVFHNRINTRYEKARVDLSATAEFDGHEVTLNRTFNLDLRSAFKPTFEPATITVEPGGTAKFKILANRTPTYDGEVTVVPTLNFGMPFPEKIVIPAGQPHVELSIPIPADRSPGRISVRCETTGQVGRYEEHLREPNLTIDVKKPPEKKTK
jgi:hypothetical protein